ncbi:MAG: hypothetical protein IPL79_08665 [Myxococcales bacterium]|nr:hypothetical protein [Myxococcales bacterium]
MRLAEQLAQVGFGREKFSRQWRVSSQWSICSRKVLGLNSAPQLPKNHILSGMKLNKIATRIDSDDVLYLIDSNLPKIALIHLTYAKETEAAWPIAQIYENLDEFLIEESP